MSVSEEELAAYADGELEGAEAARVLLAVAASPELMRRAQMHRALRAKLASHFAPTLDQEVPERLTAVLEVPPAPPRALPPPPGAQPAAGASREERPDRRGRPGRPERLHHGGVLALTLAAAMALAVLLH